MIIKTVREMNESTKEELIGYCADLQVLLFKQRDLFKSIYYLTIRGKNEEIKYVRKDKTANK